MSSHGTTKRTHPPADIAMHSSVRKCDPMDMNLDVLRHMDVPHNFNESGVVEKTAALVEETAAVDLLCYTAPRHRMRIPSVHGGLEYTRVAFKCNAPRIRVMSVKHYSLT